MVGQGDAIDSINHKLTAQEAHLKISLQATLILAAVFAVICFGVAISGFTSLGDIADPTEASDARGFAWFWAFLASTAMVLGLLAWWMARTQEEDEDA